MKDLSHLQPIYNWHMNDSSLNINVVQSAGKIYTHYITIYSKLVMSLAATAYSGNESDCYNSHATLSAITAGHFT
jgi:hypothetical protein